MASAGDPPTGPRDAADQNFDYMFKLLLIGNSSVGKTSFLFRYADDSFTPAFVSTVGIDFKVKTVYRHDKRIKLQIWVGQAGLPVLSLSLPRKAPQLCLSFLSGFTHSHTGHLLGAYCVLGATGTEQGVPVFPWAPDQCSRRVRKEQMLGPLLCLLSSALGLVPQFPHLQVLLCEPV